VAWIAIWIPARTLGSKMTAGTPSVSAKAFSRSPELMAGVGDTSDEMIFPTPNGRL
jgi:hypothetical protein